jgi:hypothetical protein
VYNTIAAEEMGKPSVAVTNQTYLVEEGSAASGRGMPGVRVVWDSIHSEEWVDERDSPERVEAGVAPLLDNIIDALTRPLTDEEKSPKQKEPEKPSRILFRGDLNEVNQFFYRRGWGDGLPVIPPTEAAVAEMLTGTDLPPDHVVTRMGPRLGKATVEKIAVNAVMAGALPTHLPVIIAGVQALPERATRWDNYQDSQGSWVPFWIINGPVRNDILVNCGIGIFSPGDIANAAIGRAMGLIIKNIGGIRKGIEDAGSFGNPGKYTMVIGEWEEESPWESFHVERGFKKEDSTLSVLFPNMFRWTIPMGVGAEGILDPIAMNIRAYGMCVIVIPPGTAKFLSDEGFTKQKTKEYIAEHAPPMEPFRLQSSDDSRELPPMPPPGSSTDHMTILVAGGPGGAYIASGAWIQWQEYVTKKIELPKAWDKLVAKYKNLAPVYAKY